MHVNCSIILGNSNSLPKNIFDCSRLPFWFVITTYYIVFYAFKLLSSSKLVILFSH